MKNYLNGEERRIAVGIMCVYGVISVILERTNALSKDEIKFLKYINTYIDKYIQALEDRVGKQEIQRIYNEAINSRIEVKPKSYEGQFIVDKDSLEEVARMAVEANCFGCKRKDWHNCGLYKCMHKVGIGNVDEDYDGCEYYYPVADETKKEEAMAILKNLVRLQSSCLEQSEKEAIMEIIAELQKKKEE